jgi:peroxiredoxin
MTDSSRLSFPAGSGGESRNNLQGRCWIPCQRPQGMTTVIFLFLVCFIGISAYAEGMLPAVKSTPTTVGTSTTPFLLVGQNVPGDLTVVDPDGHVRPVLSYKSTVELLILAFYSPRCPANQAAWWDLQRFYDKYKGWSTVFLGVSSNSNETLDELQTAMQKAGLTHKAVRDDQHHVADKLHILQTPELVIIDEWGILRYRGPLKSADGKILYAQKALDALIGHFEQVPLAEPDLGPGCPIQ